jgi:hypothetical protein
MPGMVEVSISSMSPALEMPPPLKLKMVRVVGLIKSGNTRSGLVASYKENHIASFRSGQLSYLKIV